MPFRPVERLRSIEPSQIRENMRIAREVNAINLAQGRPDFPTDPAILMSAVRAIADGHNQYSVSWGLEELRVAVADSLAERFGVGFDPDAEVTITCGVTEAMVAAIMSLVQDGDEVIVIEPAHENYVPAIRFAGGEPKFVTLRPPDYALTVDELEQAATERTRAIILNTPHNPSGHVFTREETRLLLDFCARRNCYLITDEIYDQLLYDEYEHIMPAAEARNTEIEEKGLIVTTGGLSKIYAATGWRLGYVAATSELTNYIRTVHDYLTICAPTPLQHAAVTALSLPESYYQDLRQSFTRRRAQIMSILKDTGFTPYEPQGAYYLMAEFEKWNFEGDSDAFTRMLILDGGIATVPGTAFYYRDKELGKRLVRFSFAKSEETIESVRELLEHCYEREAAPLSG